MCRRARLQKAASDLAIISFMGAPRRDNDTRASRLRRATAIAKCARDPGAGCLGASELRRQRRQLIRADAPADMEAHLLVCLAVRAGGSGGGHGWSPGL